MQGKITVEHSIPNEYKWPDPGFIPQTQDSEGLWSGAATSGGSSLCDLTK